MTRAVVAVGVDIGGTTTKAGAVNERGEVLYRVEAPTPAASTDPAEVLSTIVRTGQAVIGYVRADRAKVSGVGFGIPVWREGPDWTLHNCLNIPALLGVDLRPVLADAFGDNIACDLDTQAAATAELCFGPSDPSTRLLFMSIGTGISCAVAVDGHFLRYSFGNAGDNGHIIVDPSAPQPCSCGGRGCLESLASGPAIERSACALLGSGKDASDGASEDTSLRALAAAARAGEPIALEAFARAGRYIGIGLASLLHIYAPEEIVIGGGVAEAGDVLMRPARRALDEFASGWFLSRLRCFRLASFGADSGIVGAASLTLKGEL
jgi:glucokinase